MFFIQHQESNRETFTMEHDEQQFWMFSVLSESLCNFFMLVLSGCSLFSNKFKVCLNSLCIFIYIKPCLHCFKGPFNGICPVACEVIQIIQKTFKQCLTPLFHFIALILSQNVKRCFHQLYETFVRSMYILHQLWKAVLW